MKTNMLTNMMGAMGRGGDSMMAHLTPGDVVIPRDIVLQNPEFLTRLKKAMENVGADYRSHITGSGYENYNPETGAPEFFFSGFKNFFSNPGKQISQAVNNPIGALVNTFNTGTAVGKFFNSQQAPTASTPEMPTPSLGAVEQPFTPTRGDEPTKPFDLFSRDVGGQAFNTLDPMQQRSYLATQGSQGGGIGDEEKNYYLGLLKRNLIDESGQMQNMNTALLPVERNYLSRLGLPTDNTTDFFRALQS